MKNQKIKDNFLNPRHMGIIDNPTHQSIIKSETCSDVVKMTMIINNGIVKDIKTQVYGCGYAIAGTSIFNDIAIGKKISEIYDLAAESINILHADVPEGNRNCIRLALKAYKKILDNSDKKE